MIVGKDIYDTYVRSIWQSNFECLNCEKFDLCPVCPGINYSATGNAHKPSLELCKYTSAIYNCRSKKQTANIEEKLE